MTDRQPFVIEVDDRPIPVQIGTRLFEFVPTLTARQIAEHLGPIRKAAANITDQTDSEQVADWVDLIVATLGRLLVDPDQYDDWVGLDLPLGPLLGTEGNSVLKVLMGEWTGADYTNPAAG